MYKDNLDRRSIVKSGATLVGAGIFGVVVPSQFQQPNPNVHHYYNVRDFGATGKREDNATIPVRNAIEACTKAGGGLVFVPPGDYTVGTIQLKDNVTLHLEAGATFFLSQDQQDFIQGSRSMIFAENAKNIAVTGRGTLNGLGQSTFSEMEVEEAVLAEEIKIAREAGIDMRRYYRTGMRVLTFILNDCTNVLLQDFTLIDSPLWSIRLSDCNRVFIRGVHIYSDLEKGATSDGIDICSSHNVTISDSVIVTGDDCIVLKTPSRRDNEKVNTVENVVVTNCILTSSSAPLKIGTETHADIKHVVFSNCTIRNSNKGFSIDVLDGATVSNVIFSNLTIETNRRHWNWWGSAELCKIILKRRTEKSKLGKIKNIVVDNIVSRVRGTSTIKGHLEQPLENIRMNNVQMFMTSEDAKDKRATDALIVENINGLKINGLSIKWDEVETEAKWKSALVVNNVNDFELRSFSGRQGLKNSNIPTILLNNISEGLIAESRAESGCTTFIQLSEKEKENLTLRDNISEKAKRTISYT